MNKITVLITETVSEEYTETVLFTLTEKPTPIVAESDYGNRKEVKFERTFEPRDITKTRSREIVLLRQELEDKDRFNLAAVIKAVNGLE